MAIIGGGAGHDGSDIERDMKKKGEKDGKTMGDDTTYWYYSSYGDNEAEEDGKRVDDDTDSTYWWSSTNSDKNANEAEYSEWVAVGNDRISMIDGEYHVAMDGLKSGDNYDYNGNCNEYSVIIGVLSLLLMLAVGYIFKMKYNGKTKYFGEKYENYNSINIESDHGNDNPKTPLIE